MTNNTTHELYMIDDYWRVNLLSLKTIVIPKGHMQMGQCYEGDLKKGAIEREIVSRRLDPCLSKTILLQQKVHMCKVYT